MLRKEIVLLLSALLLLGCNQGTTSSGGVVKNEYTPSQTEDTQYTNQRTTTFDGENSFPAYTQFTSSKCKVNWVYVYASYTYVTYKTGCYFGSVKFRGAWKDRAASTMLLAYSNNYWVWFSHTGTSVRSYAI
jgi:hypothetical protein